MYNLRMGEDLPHQDGIQKDKEKARLFDKIKILHFIL